jgi:hypothetical protein
MTEPEFDENGTMKWQRVVHKLYRKQTKAYIVADRHLPNGVRQHMTEGTVPSGTIISNAEVIGESDGKHEFAEKLSHLSKVK